MHQVVTCKNRLEISGLWSFKSGNTVYFNGYLADLIRMFYNNRLDFPSSPLSSDLALGIEVCVRWSPVCMCARIA